MWRCLPSKSRGEPRTLVDNVVPHAVVALEGRWPHGPGRFRLEFRDAKRIVARVEYIEVAPAHEGGALRHTKGRRAGPRIVPPPRHPHAPAPVDLLVKPTPTTATLAKTSSLPVGSSGSRDPFLVPKPPPPGYFPMFHATAGWITHPKGVAPPSGYDFAENSLREAVIVPRHLLPIDYVESQTRRGVVVYVWNPPPEPPPVEKKPLSKSAIGAKSTLPPKKPRR